MNSRPIIGSGIQYYQRLNRYISNEGLNFNIDECLSIQRMKDIIETNIQLIGNCKFNDRENNPIKLKKNGTPSAKQSEIINGQDYEGVLVKFLSQNNDIWDNKNTEGIYFITFNDKIVKIGMTTTSFCERFSSYICGARRAMKKGSCSTTNFLICETLYTGLQLGFNVDIYGIPIQKERRNINAYGRDADISVSVVKAHEEIITKYYMENNYNRKPPLCVQVGDDTS
jgi:hypothetical protein